MFIDEFTRIRDSEANAEKIVRDARSGSRRMLEEARLQAQHKVAEAEEKAREIYDAYIAEGEKISADEYEDYLRQARIDSDKMAEKAEVKKQQAIDLIAERIVSTSVNS